MHGTVQVDETFNPIAQGDPLACMLQASAGRVTIAHSRFGSRIVGISQHCTDDVNSFRTAETGGFAQKWLLFFREAISRLLVIYQ